MKSRNFKKYAGFTTLGVVVCLCAFLFIKNIVFGSYEPSSPLIVASSVSKASITVTDMNSEDNPTYAPACRPTIATGGAISGGAISGGGIGTPTPLPSQSPLPEIPVSIGGRNTKGEATNPFVILEVVPDKALQTLSYLVEGSEPFDLSEISREQTLLDNSGNYTQNWRNGLSSFFNQSWAYDGVYFESDYINALGKGTNNYGRLVNDNAFKNHGQAAAFSVKKVFECDASSFDDEAFNGLSEDDKAAYKTLYGRAYDLKYTSVTKEQKEATQNWKITSSTKSEKKTGYMVKVAAGTGDFRYQNPTFVAANNTNEKVWKFVEEEPTTGTDVTAAHNSDKNNAANNASVGSYIKLTDFNVPLKHYVYHEICNNNVLEHMIMRFDTAADYANFHMKVVVVTPEEVNEMALYDNESTLDYIERADMFYIQDACISSDSFAQQGVDLYQKYGVHSTEQKNVMSIEHFSNGHDLEWSSCLKIMQRLGDDNCLPMLYGTSLGMEGNSTYSGVHTYYSNNSGSQKCKDRQSVLSNVLKMFMVTTEFDMLARKSDGVDQVDNNGKIIDGSTFYPKRTFMEDIYPKLLQAQLAKENGNAFFTGYYNRLQCEQTGVSSDAKECANYLWNKYTFVPISANLSDGDLQNKDTLVSYGYSQYMASKMFTQDGDIGKLGLGRPSGAEYGNVLGVGAQDGAENKWMVDTTVFNKTGTVLYEILNGLFLKAKPLEVKVKDAIEDPDDTTIGVTTAIYFVDYDSRAKYKSGINIRINFSITNRNNLDGDMNIYLVDPDYGKRKSLIPAGELSSDIKVPAGEETTSSDGVKSVNPKTTDYHIDIPLEEWLGTITGSNPEGNRYTQILFKGTGWHKFDGLPKKKAYSTYTLEIAERALFNLE